MAPDFYLSSKPETTVMAVGRLLGQSSLLFLHQRALSFSGDVLADMWCVKQFKSCNTYTYMECGKGKWQGSTAKDSQLHKSRRSLKRERAEKELASRPQHTLCEEMNRRLGGGNKPYSSAATDLCVGEPEAWRLRKQAQSSTFG